jgi:hypothetical protein
MDIVMRRLLAFVPLVAVSALLAQEAPPVSLSPGPPAVPFELVYNYTSTNVTSICYAASMSTTGNRELTFHSISAATNASAAVFTTTATLNQNTRPTVIISGATGNWAPVNGTFVATPTGAHTFSIPVNSTGFSTLTGTLAYQSTAPMLDDPFWAVELLTYNGSNNVVGIAWLNGSTGYQAKCTDNGSTTLGAQ